MSRELYEDEARSRYEEIYADFKNLAINRFKWENLPIGLTSERLEEMLIEHGQVMAYKRPNGGVTILPCFGLSRINVYGIHEQYMVQGANGYTDTVNYENGILIKNNPLGTPNVSSLELFAKRIDDTEMTQDVNLFQQNIPKMILTDENGKLTAKALIQKLKSYKFIIFGKKSLTSSIATSEVLDTSSPYLLDKLEDYKSSLFNNAMTLLGINNNNVNKKERMVVDEVNANNDLISINLDLMFEMRERACKDINDMFGSDIKVSKREVEQIEPIHTNDKTNTR